MFLLDVRNPQELAVESVPGAVNIHCRSCAPDWASCRRDRRDPPHLPLCHAPYSATRILLQNGFKARNISGGMLSRWCCWKSEEYENDCRAIPLEEARKRTLPGEKWGLT